MTPVVYLMPLLVALATAAPTTPQTTPQTTTHVTTTHDTPTPEPPNGIRQCARSECPAYTWLEDYGSNMYKRRLEPGLWVTKVSPTCNQSAAITTDVYMALHNYFVDNNIPRTTPVLLDVSENTARSETCPEGSVEYPICCENIFNLAFYIPSEHQATAPEPSPESGVLLINSSEPMDFYVTVFSGRAVVQNVTQELNELLDYLELEHLSYVDHRFAIASYDAPWRPKPHRNEVWVPVTHAHDTDGDNDGDHQGDNHGDNQGDNHGDHQGDNADEDHHDTHGDNDHGNDGNNDNHGSNESGDRRQNRPRARRSLDVAANIDLIPWS